MPATTNSISSRLMQVIGGLAAAGILGTVGMAIAQQGLKTQVNHNTEILADRRQAVAAIPVIIRDLEHIKETMEKDQKRNEEQHQKILRAIENRR